MLLSTKGDGILLAYDEGLGDVPKHLLGIGLLCLINGAKAVVAAFSGGHADDVRKPKTSPKKGRGRSPSLSPALFRDDENRDDYDLPPVETANNSSSSGDDEEEEGLPGTHMATTRSLMARERWSRSSIVRCS